MTKLVKLIEEITFFLKQRKQKTKAIRNLRANIYNSLAVQILSQRRYKIFPCNSLDIADWS